MRVTVLPHPHLETPHYEISYNPEGFAPTSYERTEATRSSEKELGYEASDWHLEDADQQPSVAPVADKHGKKKPQQAAQQQQTPAAAPTASSSPCAWLENLFVQKQAATVDQARTANNAAAAIEQMVNGGAVSRGQFGQVTTPVAVAPTPVASNNVYLSATSAPQKAEQRDFVEKNSEKEEKSQRHNKKRNNNKQREQREQPQEQNQVVEEVVQMTRQEQRQEQREQKRQRQQQRHPQQQDQQNEIHAEQAVPRRDRNNQQRPNRPNRHRDQSVFNEQQAAVATPAPVVVDEQQVKVEVIDAPRQDILPTALVVNVDQAQSEIIAINTTSTAKAVEAEKPTTTETSEVVKATPVAVEPEAKVEVEVQTQTPTAEVKTEEQKPRSDGKRASNDPRQRRRQQRDAQAKQVQAPKLNPSQVPTLSQYTVGSLIRQVYGEDCAVLIEQFGLIPTFNRALEKFTAEYAASLNTSTVNIEVEKKPVTRDVEVAKATPEAEPAPVLDLTPPKPESEKRVANDPRERRRLAKQAAEQALAQAKQAQMEEAPVVAEPTAVAVVEKVAEVVEPVEAATEVTVTQAVAEPIAAEEATVETKAPAKAKAKAEPVQTELAVDFVEDRATEETAAEKEEKEKARPRRPRGRPPKKTTPTAE